QQRFPERKDSFKTSSDIEVERLYYPKGDTEYNEKLGFPDTYPFTRGIQPTMYRSRFWTMRQYAGFGSASETNKRFRYLLDQGQTGLSVAFDLPTQIGYDSDDLMAEGEVGKVGVAIDTLHDMEQLLDNIPLDKVSTSMTIIAPASILLCMYVATQIVYDCDDSIAEGEVGKVGGAIETSHHMEQLLDNIPLDKVSTSITINAPASI